MLFDMSRSESPKRNTPFCRLGCACALLLVALAGCSASRSTGTRAPSAVAPTSSAAASSREPHASPGLQISAAAGSPRRRAHRQHATSRATPSPPAHSSGTPAGHRSPVAPATRRAAVVSLPPRTSQPAPTLLSSAGAVREVQAACGSYLAGARHGGQARAAATLASSLLTLPIDVPPSSKAVRMALASKYQELSAAIIQGTRSAAAAQAAQILPVTRTYAGTFGVTGCG